MVIKMIKFCDRLKIARKRAKMTQQQIAMILNVPQSNISKYENGNLEPNIQILIELIKNYKTTADYILGIENEYKNEEETIIEKWRDLTEREKGQFEHLYKEIQDERERKKKENAG